MTAPDDLSALREKPFADAVAKLEGLLAQSSRTFLIGAGCSKCAGLPLTEELTGQMLSSDALDETSKAILKAIRDQFEGAHDANIEDYLSELIDLLAIANRRIARSATQTEITLAGVTYSEEQLRTAADKIKRGIAKIIENKVSIEIHRSFVKAVHRPLRLGKPTPGEAVDYLVLNYDTILEDALALERIQYADGLDGGVTGWWNPQTFDRDGLSARVIKVHGSINWCELPDDPLPRRVADCLKLDAANERRILIWPASTKYREAQLDPFVQLAERARRSIRPSSGSQRVLVICGYRFRDGHINAELDCALKDSRGNLTVVVFTSDNEPTGQLGIWRKDASITEQLMVFANRGFFHGAALAPATEDLLWWKFENVTRLLGGER